MLHMDEKLVICNLNFTLLFVKDDIYLNALDNIHVKKSMLTV